MGAGDVTDKQRAALLKSMWADLRKTEHGYREGGTALVPNSSTMVVDFSSVWITAT
jgi:hypothetical protein